MSRGGLADAPLARWIGAGLALALLSACASVAPGDGERPAPDRALELECSRLTPSMQTAVLEAVAFGGGPLAHDLVGWMCGRGPQGTLVRIVFLDYVDAAGRTEPERRVPVVFEDGRLAGFGWSLLEHQPDRYGVPLPARGEEWSTPPGWVSVR